MKYVGYAVLAVVGIIALSFIGSMIGGITSVVTAPGKIISKTADPDNIIYNYEWFKRQYNDVLAIDQQIANAKTAIDEFKASAPNRPLWTFEDKQEWARLNTIALGLQNQRASMVAEYNAKTQMANRNIFRTGDLPDTIN